MFSIESWFQITNFQKTKIKFQIHLSNPENIFYAIDNEWNATIFTELPGPVALTSRSQNADSNAPVEPTTMYGPQQMLESVAKFYKQK